MNISAIVHFCIFEKSSTDDPRVIFHYPSFLTAKIVKEIGIAQAINQFTADFAPLDGWNTENSVCCVIGRGNISMYIKANNSSLFTLKNLLIASFSQFQVIH
jgi:hypothetical protein